MNGTLENGTNSSFSFTPYSVVETSMTSIKLIMGLPMNIYVLWLMLNGAGGTIASEFFYLNLITSLMLSNLNEVLYYTGLLTNNYILNRATAFMFVLSFCLLIPSFQCCICVERYTAVVHPVAFLRYKALRYRVACCCVVWLMSLAGSLSVAILGGVYPYYFIVGFWVVCISVVCFCCLFVLRALKQPGPGEGQKNSGEENDLKRRAFRIILISSVVMSVTVVSCIPIILCPILTKSSPLAKSIASILIMMSVFVHPLLYLHKAGKLPCFKAL